MPTRADLIAEARSWEGVRWRHMGEDRNGIDCGKFIRAAAIGAGVIASIELPPYPKRPTDPRGFIGHFLRAGCRIKPHRELMPADILIMRLERYPFHCGLYTGGVGDGKLIHAYAKSPYRRVVEMDFSGELRRGWTHCLSVPGLSS